MFLGEYEHTLDDKGRLTIPFRYRGHLADGLVVTRGFERCLYIYDQDGWKAIVQWARSLEPNKQNTRAFLRAFFSMAAELVPDKQGRILLPANLREFADLKDEVRIAGVLDHLEVWNAEEWRKERQTIDPNLPAIAEELDFRISHFSR